MSVLEDIHTVLSVLEIPIETGVFSDRAPTKYIVVVPLADTFELHADNTPGVETQEARLSLFTQGSYMADKKTMVKTLINHDFTITGRRYIGYEEETGYHHYAVDVAKIYDLMD